MTDNKPLFGRSYRLANEILVSSRNISDFPFSVKAVVNEKGKGIIKCKSFSKASKYDVDIKAFGSESAIVMKFHGKYIIFYDDSEPTYRVNFSIIHELGHFLLGHDLNLPKGEKYDRQEIETNFFAAQLLMPEQIIREFQHRNTYINQSFIQSTFNTSGEAARKRIDTLAKNSYEWKSRAEREFDDAIIYKYRAFIDRVCPLRKDYYDYESDEEMQNKRNSWF